jgi:hypothetical protein
MDVRWIVPWFALATWIGCQSSPESPSPISLSGVWGGDHITLTVTETGSRLEFDCAHGDIPGRLTPDASGMFATPGVFVREHGGPIREGESPDALPAMYLGTVTAATLRLTVRLTESNEVVGTFNLIQGSQGRVFKCL